MRTQASCRIDRPVSGSPGCGIGANTAIPLYKPLCIVTLVVTAISAGHLSKRLWNSPLAGWVTALFVLVGPMSAMSVGEVDTVSQLQAALFGVLLLHVVADSDREPKRAWLLALLTAAAIMSKETAFGVAAVPVGLAIYYSDIESYLDVNAFPLEPYDVRQQVELCGNQLINRP